MTQSVLPLTPAKLRRWPHGLAAATLGMAGISMAQTVAPPVAHIEAPALSSHISAEEFGARNHAERESSATPWPAGQAPASVGFDLSRVTVIVLPNQQLAVPNPRARPHHALSLQSDTVRDAFRSLGLAASDCATQVRMPTRLRAASADAGMTLDAQLQVRFACRF